MKQIGIIFGALLGFLVITIWVPIQTHIAMQNAFAYKKGKSRRKKEWKMLTWTQKLCMLPQPKQVEIYAPFHLRIFRVFMIVFLVITLLGMILVCLTVVKCISIHTFNRCLMIRGAVLDVPFGLYCRVLWNSKKASCDFSICKRP